MTQTVYFDNSQPNSNLNAHMNLQSKIQNYCTSLMKMPLIPFLLLLFLGLLPATLEDCPTHCGNLSIPFPFGTKPGCHLPGFFLTCNSTFSPPQTFISTGNIQLTSISLSASTVTVLTVIARDCSIPITTKPNFKTTSLDVTNLPYAISNTRNKFTALGCSTLAVIYRYRSNSDLDYTTGCFSICNELSSVINGTCSGIGCCQTSIPRGLQRTETILQLVSNNSNALSFSPCSYAFLIDQEQYVFRVSDLMDFYERDWVPMVLDWAVGGNQSCEEARTSSTYLCGDNTFCTNSTNAAGYHCTCQNGFDGNPYLEDGCKDINECDDANTNSCSHVCENTYGSYVCSCPHGYTGDGKKTGSGCNKRATKFPLIQVIVGCGVGLLFLILASFTLHYLLKKRRMIHLKQKFFIQNGGHLLQQQLLAHEGQPETARIFTAEELKLATDNYADNRILGQGANGTVYKGILPGTGRVVAIKKSKFVESVQIEQFINEVVLLSQVIHKNVVRILGCCLETQVPLLVYECVPNGTLGHHIHKRPGTLSWLMRLNIAGETAGALAYLHSAIERPIFHRDVKSANILLDHNYMAKVSDFGASRLIPLDVAQITTLVIGTLGYLDPEYFQTGQLTEKSDVYSFGVVLAELLTGKTPLSNKRPENEKNLANYFLLKLKNGKLGEIVEERVKNEGMKEDVEAIAELTKRCLGVKGEERPTMKEVAAEIERVRRQENYVWHTAQADLVAVEEEQRRLLSAQDLSESTRYFTVSATGDENLSRHIS